MSSEAKILEYVETFSGLCHFNTSRKVAAQIGVSQRVARRCLASLVYRDRIVAERVGGSTFYRKG